MPIIENHNHDRQDITKTQVTTGVVSIEFENGGVIVMATKKPHEGSVNAQGDFEIIAT
jgi:frataxin-like iron-binding protein CyaY